MTRFLLGLGIGAFMGAATMLVIAVAAYQRPAAVPYVEDDDGIQPAESIAQIAARWLQ